MHSSDTERPIEVCCENIDCQQPDSFRFTPSEFESFLNGDDFHCSSCGDEMSATGYRIYCYICDMEVEGYSLSQIPLLLQERCASCAGREEWNADFYSICIAGSWFAEFDMYDWSMTPKQADDLKRKGRTDYWEGLVHFCSAEEFVSIYKERCIRSSSTGLYNKRNPTESKAVCLTETTVQNWQEIKDVHGEYGFVFRKSEVIGLNGAPVISLPQSVIDTMKMKNETIPKTLWPYLTKLSLPTARSQKKIDFLHEREWRVPSDMRFDEITPYAVVFPKARPGIAGEELILQAAREFQEISESDLITVEDVKAALRVIPHIDLSKIEGESETVHTWLMRNEVRTREQLTALSQSKAIFDFLAKVYTEELGRLTDTPLDPTAVGTWAASLFVYGLRDENKESVVEQIRATPEYINRHES
ncbi:hypothetical protein [Planctomicrobium sp. SH527]|uniref:hypothetical protein n=1 Tax=Planctomicrobium sp. SH527 TaxID=3448123 RepID=UPI003F5CB94B